MSQFSRGLQWSRRLVVVSATLVALAPLVPSALYGQGRNKDYPYGVNQQSRHAYAIGLWGDLPYSDEQAAVIPSLIADMNGNDLVFSVHDGDLRQGSGSPNCADNGIYTRAAGYFANLRAPAIFTLGDNDWADCDRQSLGANGRNSLQELDNERARFFDTPYTLGQTRFLQEVQSTPTCKGFGTANDNVGPGSNVNLPQTATYTDVPCVREPPLDCRLGDVRHAQHSGLLQQPLRRLSGSRGIRRPQCGQHPMDERHLRHSRRAELCGGDVHHAGRSGLG